MPIPLRALDIANETSYNGGIRFFTAPISIEEYDLLHRGFSFPFRGGFLILEDTGYSSKVPVLHPLEG